MADLRAVNDRQEAQQQPDIAPTAAAVVAGQDAIGEEEERGARILASLQFSRDQYVKDVADMENGPFSRTVMDKYDKRFETKLQVSRSH